MTIHRWNAVRGTFGTELIVVADDVFDSFDQHVADLDFLSKYGDNLIELTIDFRSSGYEDTGKRYGDPSECYPPEGADNRSLIEAYVSVKENNHRKNIKLPDDVQSKLFWFYKDQIDSERLPEPTRDYY